MKRSSILTNHCCSRGIPVILNPDNIYRQPYRDGRLCLVQIYFRYRRVSHAAERTKLQFPFIEIFTQFFEQIFQLEVLQLEVFIFKILVFKILRQPVIVFRQFFAKQLQQFRTVPAFFHEPEQPHRDPERAGIGPAPCQPADRFSRNRIRRAVLLLWPFARLCVFPGWMDRRGYG